MTGALPSTLRNCEERWRTFIAVELPPEVKAGLSEPLVGLQRLGDLVRVSPLDGIHLTLAFLGHIEVEVVEEIARRLEPVTVGFSRCAVDVSGLGAFPSMGRPRILWIGCEGAGREALIALQAAVAQVVTGLGLTLEDRQFQPHLTLGRLRRPPAAADRAALRRWQSEGSSLSLRLIVDSVSLMRSDLSVRPPEYTTLRTYRLK